MEAMAKVETHAPRSSCVAMFAFADTVIDWERIAALATNRGPTGKYYDVGKALYEGWQHAEQLSLIDSPPLRVLDLGTGSGAFPFVCRYLGHEAVGLDIPNAGRHHSELRQALGVPAFEHRITPMHRLPHLGNERYDLITGFRVQFDRRSGEERWTPDDWAFFLDDVRDHWLKPNGRLAVYVRLTPERLSLFSDRGGALVNEKHKLVLFNPLR